MSGKYGARTAVFRLMPKGPLLCAFSCGNGQLGARQKSLWVTAKTSAVFFYFCHAYIFYEMFNAGDQAIELSSEQSLRVELLLASSYKFLVTLLKLFNQPYDQR